MVEPPSYDAVFKLAEREALTVYDAAYLDLALRERADLATLDEDLRRTATDTGVALFEP